MFCRHSHQFMLLTPTLSVSFLSCTQDPLGMNHSWFMRKLPKLTFLMISSCTRAGHIVSSLKITWKGWWHVYNIITPQPKVTIRPLFQTCAWGRLSKYAQLYYLIGTSRACDHIQAYIGFQSNTILCPFLASEQQSKKLLPGFLEMSAIFATLDLNNFYISF
jgi:hypothetical protein